MNVLPSRLILAAALSTTLAIPAAFASTAKSSSTVTIGHTTKKETSAQTAPPKNDAKTLIIADSRGDRGMLSPYVHHKNGFGYLYTGYVFDTLLGQNKDSSITSGLAQTWEVSDNGTVYNIELARNAQWHDGTPVTAKDVAFTFSYTAQHPYTFAPQGSIHSVEAVSDHHVRITLKHPDNSLPTTTLVSLPILPRHIFQGQDTPNQFTTAKSATGSGPYKLANYDKALGRYILTRNAAFYGNDAKFDKLAIIRMRPDAAIQAAKSRQIDVISKLPYSRIAAAKQAGLNVSTASSNHPARLAFNHFKRFQDKTLRHALAYVIDRKAILDIVYQGGGTIAETGYFQKDSPWHAEQNDPQYTHDLIKATSLLKKHGWTRNGAGRWEENGKPVQLNLISGKKFKNLAKVVGAQLESFGVAVDIRIMGRSEMSSQIKANDYDLALLTISTNGDPATIARRVFGRSWKGERFQRNEEMKAVIKAQQQIQDPKERKKLLHRFQELYADELPSYMLVNPYWSVAYNDKATPYFMPNGVAFGIPLAVHRYAFIN